MIVPALRWRNLPSNSIAKTSFMPVSPFYSPETTHAALGEVFFDAVEPAHFPEAVIRYRNQRWAARVGLQDLDGEEWLRHFARFEPLPQSLQTPLALRYHGHQFRSYNPQLGDGRGFLFGQLRDCKDGRLLDLGTKGSGLTPWSRGGDGRLTLKGGVREVLATEMLEAIGVLTSKSFSLIETGENLMRHDEPSPTRSSVLVRLSHSHIRIGTFQRLAYHKDDEAIARLLDHVIEHYIPSIAGGTIADRALAFVEEVGKRSARLAAQWMAAGFVHGVLNSDNINVTGESFDYGPWRFVPTYDPNFVAAYYDETGLYAFGRQPSSMAWNVARLAECFLPFSDAESLTAKLDAFAPALQQSFADEILRRLGLLSAGHEKDAALASAFAGFLMTSQAPFEQAFFDWFGGKASAGRAAKSPAASFYATTNFEAVKIALFEYAPAALPKHSYFQRQRPCTMLIDELERIWDAIAERDDWQPFNAKLAEIAEMRDAYRMGPDRTR